MPCPFVWFPDDGTLRAETCRVMTCDIAMQISKEEVCVFCWFSFVNVIDNARNEQYQVSFHAFPAESLTRSVHCSVADLSSWTPGFDPRPAKIRFVMGKVELGQVFLHVLFTYPADTIHQMLRTNPSILPWRYEILTIDSCKKTWKKTSGDGMTMMMMIMMMM